VANAVPQVGVTDADDYDLFGIIIEGSSTAATN